MSTVLKLKHWQIFGLFILYESMLALILNFSQIQTPWVLDILLFNVIPIFGYPLLLTHALDKYFDVSKGHSFKGMKAYDVFWLLMIIGLLISEGFADRENELTIGDITGTEMTIKIILMLFQLYFLIRFYKVPSKALKSIELKRDAGLWEYIADAFQFFAWPLCIWWAQPRINVAFNRLNQKRIATN